MSASGGPSDRTQAAPAIDRPQCMPTRPPKLRTVLEPSTHFLNVDLDLYPSGPIPELIQSLEKSAHVCHADERIASLELNEWRLKSAEATIRFTPVVTSLRGRARAQWRSCSRRVMNVGIQAGLEPHGFEESISREVVTVLHHIGAELVFTIYPARHTILSDQRAAPRTAPKAR